jgi:hypothetical protein
VMRPQPGVQAAKAAGMKVIWVSCPSPTHAKGPSDAPATQIPDPNVSARQRAKAHSMLALTHAPNRSRRHCWPRAIWAPTRCSTRCSTSGPRNGACRRSTMRLEQWAYVALQQCGAVGLDFADASVCRSKSKCSALHSPAPHLASAPRSIGSCLLLRPSGMEGAREEE